jgi:hypothetical protein
MAAPLQTSSERKPPAVKFLQVPSPHERPPLGGVSFNLRGFVFLCVQIYNGLRKFDQGSIGGAFLVKCLLQQRH